MNSYTDITEFLRRESIEEEEPVPESYAQYMDELKPHPREIKCTDPAVAEALENLNRRNAEIKKFGRVQS